MISREPEPRKPETTSTATPARTPALTASGAAAGLKDHLTDIKSTLLSQSEQISLLVREVTQLKAVIGSQSSDREKDERIRQLELELEEARS